MFSRPSAKSSATSEANERPDYDPELQAIADYVLNYQSSLKRHWKPPATA